MIVNVCDAAAHTVKLYIDCPGYEPTWLGKISCFCQCWPNMYWVLLSYVIHINLLSVYNSHYFSLINNLILWVCYNKQAVSNLNTIQ